MPTIVMPSSVTSVTCSGTPSHVAPAPRAALHSRPEDGSATAPATLTPCRVAPTDTVYQGSP